MNPLLDLRAGGKPALARALGEIERAPRSAATLALLDAAFAAPMGQLIGLTGPPGVGKSTLMNALIRATRARGLGIGVIAVDPSSRRTGGALLGDRTRLSTDPEDQRVFVRSMAARDRLGGLAALSFPAAVLMRAVFDLVIIETVGVGQSEVDVAAIADTVVFCVQPGAGDALQFMKAGVMETPHIALVTKADMGELARRAAADVKGALSLAAPRPDGWVPQVLSCSANDNIGIEPLLDALLARNAVVDAAQRRQAAGNWLIETLREEFGRQGVRKVQQMGLTTQPSAPFATEAKLHAQLLAVLGLA